MSFLILFFISLTAPIKHFVSDSFQAKKAQKTTIPFYYGKASNSTENKHFSQNKRISISCITALRIPVLLLNYDFIVFSYASDHSASSELP